MECPAPALQGESPSLLSEVLGCPFQKGPQGEGHTLPTCSPPARCGHWPSRLAHRPQSLGVLGSSGHTGSPSCLEWCQVRTFVPRSQPSFHGWLVPHACCLATPAGHSRGFCPVKTAVTLGTTSPGVSPYRPSFGQVGHVGPRASQRMKRVWRLAWGEGHGTEADDLGPPPPHQGRVWESHS